MVVPLSQVYINMVGAFKTDCENLIAKFTEKRSGDFRDFVQIWKSMKFNLVYEKYAKHGMSYDFKEDTLQIAKAIMLHDHFVGGMFLLYGLYYMQEDPKACIRIELHEFEKLVKQLKEERRTLMETCQPGYMFAKLLKNDAFAFVRFSRDFSMEGQNRARLIFSGQPILMDMDSKIMPKEWLRNFLEKVDFIDDLRKVEEQYFLQKKKLKYEHPELNLALDMVPDDIINGIAKSITQGDRCETHEENIDIGFNRRKLKMRKRKIKHRYDRPSTSTTEIIEFHSNRTKPKRKMGPPKGRRKLYFRTMVNEPENNSEDSEFSDPDDPKLCLPTID